ncbi:MAG: ATP-binding protein [Cyclobacteriaceae bacterium]
MHENLDQQITENVPEFFFIWDLASQKIIYLTQGLGDYARVELTEEPDYERMLDFVHPDYRTQFENILHSFSADHAHQDHDLQVHGEKYRAKWLNLQSFPIEDDDGQVIRIVVHISDVTQRKEKLSSLEELNEKNESVIRILAHDLKSPLNNIFMLSELAGKKMKGGDQQQVLNFLKMIREVSKDTSKLIESMLELLELTDSRLSAEMHKVDLVSLVANTLKSFAPRFQAHEVHLVQQWPEEPVHARLDAQKFQHVISNLISNALKFTPASGKVTVQIYQEKDRVLLKISDTGVGIPAEKQQEIFNEFSKARQRGLHGEKSSGLGLSIVKKIVELHQGEIRVDSTPKIGTTFTVVLPQ